MTVQKDRLAEAYIANRKEARKLARLTRSKQMKTVKHLEEGK